MFRSHFSGKRRRRNGRGPDEHSASSRLRRCIRQVRNTTFRFRRGMTRFSWCRPRGMCM